MVQNTPTDDSYVYAPLLEGEGGETKYPPHNERRIDEPRRKSRFNALVIVLQGILNIILVLALLGALIRKPASESGVVKEGTGEKMLYSPVNHLIEHEIVQFNAGLHKSESKYLGPPSPEVDQAWDNLYQYGISRIKKDEAKRIPWKTSRIPGDTDHYVVELDVFHQLHCLNMIRKALHPKYYREGGHDHALGDSQKEADDHVAHCIEHIRQAITCASDVSLIVWQWIPEKNQTFGRSGTPHTCRNFNKIAEWAKKDENRMEGTLDLFTRVPDDD